MIIWNSSLLCHERELPMVKLRVKSTIDCAYHGYLTREKERMYFFHCEFKKDKRCAQETLLKYKLG